MEPLNYITMSLHDTIAVVTTPKEMNFHSCAPSTSIEDVWLAGIIGIIVISCLWIIGHYVFKSVATIQNAKSNELISRQEHELAKLNMEAKIKTDANEFNATQTKMQRDGFTVADRIKNEGDQIKNDEQRIKNDAEQIKNNAERLYLKLREAEINEKIRVLEQIKLSSKEQIKS